MRHDYYQTETQLTVTIYVKGVQPGDVDVRVEGQTLVLAVQGGATAAWRLYAAVDPTPLAVSVRPTKIEVVLAKRTPSQWPALECAAAAPTAASAPPPRVRSKWDALAVEEPATDTELNGFFQKLYEDADPDTRRAMMKSFQESNGTALSTNWAEVAQKPTETRAPSGMEPRRYEQ